MSDRALDCMGKGRYTEAQMPAVIRRVKETAALWQEPPACAGQAVIICGGGRYLPHAWVTARQTRLLGWGGPIEVWHLTDDEIPARFRALFEPFGVDFRSIQQLRKQKPIRLMDGWNSKIYALTHTSYRHLIFLDADAFLSVPPEAIFSHPKVIEFGSVLFSDVNRCNAQNWGYDACELPRLPREIESGFMIIDRARAWYGLRWTYWMAEHADVFNRWGFGDKHFTELGMRVSACPLFINTECAWKGWGIQHSQNGTEWCRHAMGAKRGEHPWPEDIGALFGEWEKLSGGHKPSMSATRVR